MSKTNPDDTAFAYGYCTADGRSRHDHPGLTIREYFAANAPEVPDWFKHVEAEKPVQPDFKKEALRSGYSEPQAEEMLDDFAADFFVFPDNMQYVKEQFDIYWKEGPAWHAQDRIDRFFQWRTFYADQLIKQLNTNA